MESVRLKPAAVTMTARKAVIGLLLLFWPPCGAFPQPQVAGMAGLCNRFMVIRRTSKSASSSAYAASVDRRSISCSLSPQSIMSDEPAGNLVLFSSRRATIISGLTWLGSSIQAVPASAFAAGPEEGEEDEDEDAGPRMSKPPPKKSNAKRRECDEKCKEMIQARRDLVRQSKTTNSRQEVRNFISFWVG